MTEFNPLQQIKRRFFALRNGVIADTLRKGGSPFRIIFGLNVPQIADIARETGPDEDLARALWNNTSTRESMLLAPMLMDPAAVTPERAAGMIDRSPCAEVTDMLCHRLLRHAPDAFQLACGLARSQSDMRRYAAMRLLWHFIGGHTQEQTLALARSEASRQCPLTLQPARQIVDEIEFMREE